MAIIRKNVSSTLLTLQVDIKIALFRTVYRQMILFQLNLDY